MNFIINIHGKINFINMKILYKIIYNNLTFKKICIGSKSLKIKVCDNTVCVGHVTLLYCYATILNKEQDFCF